MKEADLIGRCAGMSGPKRSFRALLAGIVMLLGMVSGAHADVCDVLRAQLRSTSSGQQSPQAAQLNRQLAAIRNLERRRQCSGRGTGGFFNACGDLARRKADVQRKLQTATRSRGGDGAAILGRVNELGCTAAVARKPAPRKAAPQPANEWRAGNDTLFCVRLSDGYYFPAPNSQFVQAASYRLVQSQCQYICDDPQMAVYELTDLSLETEEMVSVDTRRPYKELPVAFRYRESPEFRACDLQRYYRRVNEARARAMTPKTVGTTNVVLPLPAARPHIDPVVASSTGNTDRPVESVARRVRVVGVPFLPNDRPTHSDLSAEP